MKNSNEEKLIISSKLIQSNIACSEALFDELMSKIKHKLIIWSATKHLLIKRILTARGQSSTAIANLLKGNYNVYFSVQNRK